MLFRRLIASLLLLTLITQTCDKLFLIADFYVNQDRIARTLCENRSRPDMRCCGKCVLRKKLAQQDKGHNNDQEKRIGSGAQPLSDDKFYPELGFTPQYSIRTYNQFKAAAPTQRARSLFHPPGVNA